jgi:hypothetical protein
VDKSTVTSKTREISHRLLRLPLLIVLAAVASGTRRIRGATPVVDWLYWTTGGKPRHLPRSARPIWTDFLDDTIVPEIGTIDDYRALDAALPIAFTLDANDRRLTHRRHSRTRSHDPSLSPISLGDDMLVSIMGRL